MFKSDLQAIYKYSGMFWLEMVKGVTHKNGSGESNDRPATTDTVGRNI